MSILSTVIADMAPAAKRGSYMGFSGFIQTLGNGLGFLIGMSLLSMMPDASLIWFVFGGIGFGTSVGYVLFAKIVGPQHNDPKVMDELQKAKALKGRVE